MVEFFTIQGHLQQLVNQVVASLVFYKSPIGYNLLISKGQFEAIFLHLGQSAPAAASPSGGLFGRSIFPPTFNFLLF